MASDGALEGKAIVVTGAGRGIGAAYARHAAEHGAQVMVNDVDEAAAEEVAASIRGDERYALAHAASVAEWDAAAALIARCVTEFGRIDGLINNAGLFAIASAAEQTEQMFRRLVDVNVLGTAFCGVHALRHMLDQGSGSIVNVTSGAQSGAKNLAAYGATKGAVATLTYSWALEVAGSGVRVNAISPNAHTRMADVFEDYLGERASGQNIGKAPELNAPAAVYLLSDLSAALNGQVVRVDAAELGVMTHPRVLQPPMRNDEWTVTDVAEAFASPSGRAMLQPVGLLQRDLSATE